MTGLTTLPAASSIDDVLEVIDRDGGVIIDKLLSDAVIHGLADDLAPVLGSVATGSDAYFAGTKTRRAGALFARSRHMVDVALNPLYLGVAEAILRQPVDVWFGEDRTTVLPEIQVGMTQAIQIAPGQGAQPLHRDDTSFLWRHPQYGKEARLQIMVALSPFTAENGGTLVIPGSHTWDDERRPTMDEAVSTEMSAGSALLFVGSTYHGGGNNTSDASRTGITMAYDLSNLRQEENQFLSVPVETVRSFPEKLQRLLGWGAGENFMGYVEVGGQMTDPNELLGREDYPTSTGGLPGVA